MVLIILCKFKDFKNKLNLKTKKFESKFVGLFIFVLFWIAQLLMVNPDEGIHLQGTVKEKWKGV